MKFNYRSKHGFTPLEKSSCFIYKGISPRRSKNTISRVNSSVSLTGFTLIELLVVIAIIGLLSSIIIVSLVSARRSARDAKIYTDLGEVKKALALYYDDHGSYPNTLLDPANIHTRYWWGKCPVSIPPIPTHLGGKDVSGPDGYIPNLAPQYIKTLPYDSCNDDIGNQNGYIYMSDGINYKLGAGWKLGKGTNCLPGKIFADPRRPAGSEGSPPAGEIYFFCAIYTPGAINW